MPFAWKGKGILIAAITGWAATVIAGGRARPAGFDRHLIRPVDAEEPHAPLHADA